MENKVKVLIVAAAALAVVALAIPSANADVGNGRHQPIIGNFTLDTHPDTATLGYDSVSCTVKVDRVYNFGLTSTKWYRYQIPGLTNFKLCPDMGAAVPTGKKWTADDLIVTWFINYQSGPKPAAYVLRNYTVISSFPGENYPSWIGSGVDFNGDGLQDIWEATDQGEGFRTYLRSGNTFVPGPAVMKDRFLHEPFFGELDALPGTDIVSTYYDYSVINGVFTKDTGVKVISGATGQQTILETSEGGPAPVPALLDINGDGVLDVRVTSTVFPPPDYLATTVVHDYINDGTGHFTLAP